MANTEDVNQCEALIVYVLCSTSTELITMQRITNRLLVEKRSGLCYVVEKEDNSGTNRAD